MSFAAVATLGVGAISAATSISLANRQRREQERIRSQAVDPGIQPNYGLMRSSQILADNYSNYQLPGFTRYQEQISQNAASSMSRLREAATSSEDVLAGATRIQGYENEAMGGLYTQQAQGRLSALNSYVNSINQVGSDQVRVNTMQLDRYDALLREAAALGGASNQNLNTGIQEIMMGISPLIRNFLPQQTIDPNTGQPVQGQSLFQSYF